MDNSLMVIAPYWYKGTWVFDDESVGLVREPFRFERSRDDRRSG